MLVFLTLKKINAILYQSAALTKWVRRLQASKKTLARSKMWINKSRLWTTMTKSNYLPKVSELPRPKGNSPQCLQIESMNSLNSTRMVCLPNVRREPTTADFNRWLNKYNKNTTWLKKNKLLQTSAEKFCIAKMFSCRQLSLRTFLTRKLMKHWRWMTRKHWKNCFAALL